jgi:hypothetical protein
VSDEEEHDERASQAKFSTLHSRSSLPLTRDPTRV